MSEGKVFLTARWENLILVTYNVEPDMLTPYIPKGLEPDTIEGSAFVSLVAFDFLNVKVKGFKVPFNVNFPEINLRVYVKNKERRGVVFIKELVPGHLTAMGANIFFNENYHHAEMSSEISVGEKILLTHKVKFNSLDYFIRAVAENKPFMPRENSTEHFFKEHEWGFGTTRSGESLIYKVEHPFWEIYPISDFSTNFDFGEIYGNHWKSLTNRKPYNVTFARGSHIKVYQSENLK